MSSEERCIQEIKSIFLPFSSLVPTFYHADDEPIFAAYESLKQVAHDLASSAGHILGERQRQVIKAAALAVNHGKIN